MLKKIKINMSENDGRHFLGKHRHYLRFDNVKIYTRIYFPNSTNIPQHAKYIYFEIDMDDLTYAWRNSGNIKFFETSLELDSGHLEYGQMYIHNIKFS